ncbi:hypothetical protein P7C73_g2181, partial [Tremellales sp. Uapishka_1]
MKTILLSTLLVAASSSLAAFIPDVVQQNTTTRDLSARDVGGSAWLLATEYTTVRVTDDGGDANFQDLQGPDQHLFDFDGKDQRYNFTIYAYDSSDSWWTTTPTRSKACTLWGQPAANQIPVVQVLAQPPFNYYMNEGSAGVQLSCT